MAVSPPRKRACAAVRRSIGVTELSGLPGSEGYADCDDAGVWGAFFGQDQRKPPRSGRWGGKPHSTLTYESDIKLRALDRFPSGNALVDAVDGAAPS